MKTEESSSALTEYFVLFMKFFYNFFLTWPESVMSVRTVRTLTITFPPRINSLRQVGGCWQLGYSVCVCEVPSIWGRTLTLGVYLDTAGGQHYDRTPVRLDTALLSVLIRSCFLLLHTSGGGAATGEGTGLNWSLLSHLSPLYSHQFYQQDKVLEKLSALIGWHDSTGFWYDKIKLRRKY